MPETNHQKRLYLLDAMALIYRAHFALIRNPLYTKTGRCTSAVLGVANTLLDILNREEPTHIAAVFDTSKPTHRREAFAGYKAQREAVPEDLGAQFPLVDRLFDAFRIPSIRIPGYEADDIIATLALEAERQGFTTWMVTPDKDLQQLVDDNILIYKPGRQGSAAELLGVPQVLERWQIKRVEQVIDILGLMGDSIDNVPGVPGIGEKTAQKLIAEFGTIEDLIARKNELKGKQKELIGTHADQAMLSKKLVTIVRDVPHNVRIDTLTLQTHDDEAVKSLFVELEFDALGKRLFGSTFSIHTLAAAATATPQTAIQGGLFDSLAETRPSEAIAGDYRTVETAAEREQLIATLSSQPVISLTIVPSTANPREAAPLGIAFSFEPHTSFYVTCPPGDARSILDEFRGIFENDAIEKVGHGLKDTATILRWHGIRLRGRLFDPGLAHSMKEPESRHGLDDLTTIYLGSGPRTNEPNSVADITLQLSRAIRPDIEAKGVAQVCYEVECPLIPALVEMEYHGIRIDTAALRNYSKQLDREIEQLRRSIFEAAGKEFNIESPKQLASVLYEDLKLAEKPKKTDTGQFTTRETELLRLAGEHQIVRDVLDFRNSIKLKRVYVDQLPEYVNPATGRLHTHYSQTWTVTGRMQSNDPNLQTIPIRKERGREIRAAFVPRAEDYLLLSADYSQIELRIMAELSGDESMLEAFASGTDIHTVTAAKVFKVETALVSREMRDKAKAVNFGIIYGISAFGLQQRLNISRDEARSLINNYFEKYPRVRTYIDDTVALARKDGFVKTRTGRLRYLRDINSRNITLRNAAERLAMNSPIQGTAADMLKLAMIKVHRALLAGDFRTKMLLTVHDEIVFDMHRSEQEAVVPLIVECMKSALPMKVPIVVEVGIGTNWLEAH
jgi:DNA polymerase-1